MKIIKKIDKFLIKVQNCAILFFVAAMVILTFWQVIARYFLMISTPYAEELARLAIVWCVFIGSSLGVRFNEHIQVDAVLRLLPKFGILIVRIIIYILIAAFSVVMIIYGVHHYQLTANDFTTSLGYPRNVFYLPVPICGTLMLIYSVAACVGLIQEYWQSRKESENHPEKG